MQEDGISGSVLRRLFEAAGKPMLILDESEFVECNRACLNLLGLQHKSELTGLRLETLSPPYQPDGRRSSDKANEILDAARTNGSHTFEWLLRRQDDGRKFIVEISLSAVVESDGRCLLHAALGDITERKQREAALAESERRLRRIVEDLPAGAVYIEGENISVNRAAEAITGYSRKEVTHTGEWFRLLFGERADAVREIYAADRAAGFPSPRIVPFRRRDGKERIVEFAAYHNDSEGAGDICLLYDVTERVRQQKTETEERFILEQITGTTPLPEVLTNIALLLEKHLPGAHCAIHLVNPQGTRLELGAAPTLPTALAETLRTLPIPESDAGREAARGPLAALLTPHGKWCDTENGALVAENLTEHPAWSDSPAAQAAVENGIVSSWARCIRPGAEGPLGVLIAYFAAPCAPDGTERHLLDMVAHVAGLAIQRRRAEAELRESAERLRNTAEALRQARDELEERVRERTAELEAERARLEAVLKQMPAGVLIAEAGTGRPLLINRQLGRIWRYPEIKPDKPDKTEMDLPSIEVIGIERLLRPDLTPYTPEEFPLAETLRSGAAVSDIEFAILRCDGTRGSVLASSAPITDPATDRPVAVVITLQDITDLKNTEEALRRLHEELEMQVQERTAELALANLALQSEVRDRERAEQVSRGQTEALTRTLGALTLSGNLEDFVDQVLWAIVEQLQADGIVYSQYDTMTDTLSMQRAYLDGRRMDSAQLAAQGVITDLPGKQSALWAEQQRTLRPIVITDIENDIRLELNRAALLAEGMTSFFVVPLLRGDTCVGNFAIFTRARRRFDEAEVELAQALAKQATLALQLELLGKQARQNAILQERTRLAREIHDTLAQGFTSIIIHLQLAEIALTKKPETVLPTLLKARDVARDSLAEARRSVWALRPNALQGNHLADALRRLVDSMGAEASVTPRVEVEGTPCALPADMESHLLRLGQEALNNALKYAQASEICVTVCFEAEQIRLCIRDNGRGFDRNAPPQGSGFGHQSMRERAAALRGELTIESAPGAGTTIHVIVPTEAATGAKAV